MLKHRPRFQLLPVFAMILTAGLSWASSQNEGFENYAMTVRQQQLQKVQPRVAAPSPDGVVGPAGAGFNRYPWKRNIMTTVFWVGERPTKNNPVPNHKSSWDQAWAKNFGGYDNPDPTKRRNYLPANFIPRQNPFYVALPYNDVSRGRTKPEAPKAIPWFKQAFERAGKSVCKGRWIAIRHGNRIAYAQWEDCGPFRTDHYQYVFGNARPMANLNQGAGLDVSPAVRDYLGMRGNAYCDWKFVDFKDVPVGPWSKYGDNNTFVLKRRGADLFSVDRNNATGPLRR